MVGRACTNPSGRAIAASEVFSAQVGDRPLRASRSAHPPNLTYQAADNANDITVTHDFATLESARAFAGSPELKAAMHDAGVTSAPTNWFATRA